MGVAEPLEVAFKHCYDVAGPEQIIRGRLSVLYRMSLRAGDFHALFNGAVGVAAGHRDG